MSFTQLACFIVFNKTLIIDFADIAMFFISPFVFFTIGWLLCIYIYSFFTLLFITLNLSSFIISVINRPHISFPIVSFILLLLHIIQLLLEVKINQVVLEVREVGTSNYIIGFPSLITLIIFLVKSSNMSLAIRIIFPVLTSLLLILFISFIITKKYNLVGLVISLEADALVALARIVNLNEALCVWVFMVLAMFLVDFLYSIVFRFNGNLYIKKGFRRVCLIEQDPTNDEIIGEVYNDDTRYKVTSYCKNCLKDFSSQKLIFLPKSHIVKFNITKNNYIKKLILEINEKPNFQNLLEFLPELNEIELKCENKFISLENGIIYKNSDLSICFANKDIKRLHIREHVQTIESLSCKNCFFITKISFPDSLITIGDKAFKKCANLKSVTFSANLKYIGIDAFYYCFQLNSVSFRKCEKLETIQMYAFSHTALEKVVLPKCLKEIDLKAFVMCSYLTNVVCHEDSNVKFLTSKHFKQNPILPSIYNLHLTVKIPLTWETIPSKFYKATLGFRIEYPDFNRWNIVRIEKKAFKRNHYSSFTIPPSVEYIGMEAFAESPILKKIEFPDGSMLSYCHPTAFNKCPMLRSFIFSDENVIAALNIRKNSIFTSPWQ